jgi:TatD DNase family protein
MPPWAGIPATPKTVAIGECGLDYFRLPSSQGGSPHDDASYKRKQAEIFQQQLEVATEMKLNCVIHQRSSFDDLFAQIQPFAGGTQGVFHCFGENIPRLRGILALGWLVSFTGIVTFKNGQNIRDAVAATPLDKFMLETDCPYLAPVPYRGKRCEPAHVKEISQTIAQVRQCSAEELSAATCKTAQQFFPKLV